MTAVAIFTLLQWTDNCCVRNAQWANTNIGLQSFVPRKTAPAQHRCNGHFIESCQAKLLAYHAVNFHGQGQGFGAPERFACSKRNKILIQEVCISLNDAGRFGVVILTAIYSCTPVRLFTVSAYRNQQEYRQ